MTVPPTADGVGLTPAGMVMTGLTGLTGIAPTGGAGTALGWTSIAPALAPTITVPLELASCGEKKGCKFGMQVQLKMKNYFYIILWIIFVSPEPFISNYSQMNCKYNDLRLPQFWGKKMKREKRRKKDDENVSRFVVTFLKALLVNRVCACDLVNSFFGVFVCFYDRGHKRK